MHAPRIKKQRRTSAAVFSSLLGGAVAFSRYATIPAASRGPP